MMLIDLAVSFKKARIACRLTQKEVAEATGVGVLTISKLERGALMEIGAVKLIALFQKVGLELQVRPAGHQRTLDDIRLELAESSHDKLETGGQRVRHLSNRHLTKRNPRG